MKREENGLWRKQCCECCDPGCPAHPGISECKFRATDKVRRIDMEDGENFFHMCRKCTEDALESGVFE